MRLKKIARPANAPPDCWNHIGVVGDGSCPELAEVGHCRNCPVYVDAGAAFFNRPIPAEYRQEWTDLLRKEKETQQAGTSSIVVFQIGEEWLALPTTILREVSELRAIHRVPHRTGRVLMGMVNVRGEIQLCISLPGLLGIEPAKSDTGTRSDSARRMIVIDRNTEVWVFPVEKIHGSHRIQTSSIVNPPSTVERAASKFTRGVIQLEGMQVGCLDEENMFAALKKEMV